MKSVFVILLVVVSSLWCFRAEAQIPRKIEIDLNSLSKDEQEIWHSFERSSIINQHRYNNAENLLADRNFCKMFLYFKGIGALKPFLNLVKLAYKAKLGVDFVDLVLYFHRNELKPNNSELGQETVTRIGLISDVLTAFLRKKIPMVQVHKSHSISSVSLVLSNIFDATISDMKLFEESCNSLVRMLNSIENLNQRTLEHLNSALNGLNDTSLTLLRSRTTRSWFGSSTSFLHFTDGVHGEKDYFIKQFKRIENRFINRDKGFLKCAMQFLKGMLPRKAKT